MCTVTSQCTQKINIYKWRFTWTVLQIGLRSAPKFFSAVADSLAFHLDGINYLLHYLITWYLAGLTPTSLGLSMPGPEDMWHTKPTSGSAQDWVSHSDYHNRCQSWPAEATPGQVTVVTNICTTAEGKKACYKWTLLSLLGHPKHVTCVIPPGRQFLRHMIDTDSWLTQLACGKQTLDAAFKLTCTCTTWSRVFCSIVLIRRIHFLSTQSCYHCFGQDTQLFTNSQYKPYLSLP